MTQDSGQSRKMRMRTQRRAVDYENDDDDAAELSGWGTADFDAMILLATGAQEPTRFAAANARKKEQRRRREKEKRDVEAQEQEQAQDVVHLFHNNNNKNNTSSKTTLLVKEFAVSSCAVATPSFIHVTKVLSPSKRKHQRHQKTQQVAHSSPAQVLCKIVGLIDDDSYDTGDQQLWQPIPLVVRKGVENARFPSLVSSNSVDALLSQRFRSDLEEKLRALPVPFGAHPIGQSVGATTTTATTRTCFLPPLVDASSYNNSKSSKQEGAHVSSMRRRHHSQHEQQQQQSSLTGASHRDAHVRDLMAFPTSC